jgi:hypothetical protein
MHWRRKVRIFVSITAMLVAKEGFGAPWYVWLPLGPIAYIVTVLISEIVWGVNYLAYLRRLDDKGRGSSHD